MCDAQRPRVGDAVRVLRCDKYPELVGMVAPIVALNSYRVGLCRVGGGAFWHYVSNLECVSGEKAGALP